MIDRRYPLNMYVSFVDLTVKKRLPDGFFQLNWAMSSVRTTSQKVRNVEEVKPSWPAFTATLFCFFFDMCQVMYSTEMSSCLPQKEISLEGQETRAAHVASAAQGKGEGQ